MSLKVELETQAAALAAYDAQDFEAALTTFQSIADTSKIFTNIGLIYATLGEHEKAVESFYSAVRLDQYLAVAYFQCGVSNFLLGHFDLAREDFDEAFLYLRGNQNINYDQIGLKFVLHSAEVLFNKGLCLIYSGEQDLGLSILSAAQQQKTTAEHDVIDEAIRDRGEEYTVFSIPVGVLFRPSDTKLRNAKTKNYLGQAKLISASESHDAFTEFSGSARKARAILAQASANGQAPSIAIDGLIPPNGGTAADLSRAATTGGRVELVVPKPAGAGVVALDLGRSATLPSNILGPTRGLSERYRVKPSGPKATVGTAQASQASQAPQGPSSQYSRATPAGAMAEQGSTQSAQYNGTPDGAMTDAMGHLDISEQPQITPANLTVVNRPPPPKQTLSSGSGGRGMPPAPSPKGRGGVRLTEIYNNYHDEEEDAVPLPALPTTTIAPLRVRNAAERDEPSRSGVPLTQSNLLAPSTNTPPTSALGSIRRGPGGHQRNGGGSTSSNVSRNGSRRRKLSPVGYENDQDEEGYVSGGFSNFDETEEVMFELTKLKIKIHYGSEIRGMTVAPQVPFDEVFMKIVTKFGKQASPDSLSLTFKDEDGHKVSLVDESDWDLAIETARENSQGKADGKLEIWASDL